MLNNWLNPEEDQSFRYSENLPKAKNKISTRVSSRCMCKPTSGDHSSPSMTELMIILKGFTPLAHNPNFKDPEGERPFESNMGKGRLLVISIFLLLPTMHSILLKTNCKL